jgi:hypothetical protein
MLYKKNRSQFDFLYKRAVEIISGPWSEDSTRSLDGIHSKLLNLESYILWGGIPTEEAEEIAAKIQAVQTALDVMVDHLSTGLI